MSLRLPADVYSPDHVGIVLWELGALISRLQNASVRAQVVQNAPQEELQLSAFLMNVLQAAGVASNDLKGLEQLQAQLQIVRDKAPVAHMVLTALPNQSVKRELVEWFRTQLHAQCLVTFAMRRDIGGGFVLRIGSKQYDFSYRQQLLDNRHRLTEIFDGVRQ
jgi:F0F1-type ATP synthase delta subunit